MKLILTLTILAVLSAVCMSSKFVISLTYYSLLLNQTIDWSFHSIDVFFLYFRSAADSHKFGFI